MQKRPGLVSTLWAGQISPHLKEKKSKEIYRGTIHTQVWEKPLPSDFMSMKWTSGQAPEHTPVSKEGWEMPGSSSAMLHSRCAVPGGASHPTAGLAGSSGMQRKMATIPRLPCILQPFRSSALFMLVWKFAIYCILAWDKHICFCFAVIAHSNGSLNN